MSKISNQFIFKLEDIIDKRVVDQSDMSYTVDILNKGVGQVAKKLLEESSELAFASVEQKNTADILHEAADLIFHFLIMLKATGLTLNDVSEELESRHKN